MIFFGSEPGKACSRFLDLLFHAFSVRSSWSIRSEKERTTAGGKEPSKVLTLTPENIFHAKSILPKIYIDKKFFLTYTITINHQTSCMRGHYIKGVSFMDEQKTVVAYIRYFCFGSAERSCRRLRICWTKVEGGRRRGRNSRYLRCRTSWGTRGFTGGSFRTRGRCTRELMNIYSKRARRTRGFCEVL